MNAGANLRSGAIKERLLSWGVGTISVNWLIRAE